MWTTKYKDFGHGLYSLDGDMHVLHTPSKDRLDKIRKKMLDELALIDEQKQNDK